MRAAATGAADWRRRGAHYHKVCGREAGSPPVYKRKHSSAWSTWGKTGRSPEERNTDFTQQSSLIKKKMTFLASLCAECLPLWVIVGHQSRRGLSLGSNNFFFFLTSKEQTQDSEMYFYTLLISSCFQSSAINDLIEFTS